MLVTAVATAACTGGCLKLPECLLPLLPVALPEPLLSLGSDRLLKPLLLTGWVKLASPVPAGGLALLDGLADTAWLVD